MKKNFTLILLSIILCVPQVMAQLSQTVEITTPGTLASLLGDNKDQITELKIRGDINGTDIMTIRVGTLPKLAILDMSEGGFAGNYVYKSAFDNVSIKKIILPPTIVVVDEYAFNGCAAEELDFSRCKSLQRVGWLAFANCRNLKELDLGECTSLTSFNPCFQSLTCKLTLPKNLTVLHGLGGFFGEIVIPDSLVMVGNGALGNVTMSPMVFPETFRIVDDRSFQNSLIAEVDFSKCENIQVFGWYAFHNSHKLRRLSIGTVVPPEAKGSAFEGVNFDECILQVPYGSEDAYRRAGQWNQFKNIQALIPDTAALHDHLKLKTNIDNTHRAAPGDIIKVYAKVKNQRDLKIGLFDANGNLKAAIETSYKNSTYTCQIPSNARGGSYMIQPYYLTAQKVRILERSEESCLIDKLPLTIEEEDIWSKTPQAFSTDATISKHLQLKTAEQDLFEVEIEAEFQVYVPATDAATTVGLFSLDGVFVTDIVKSKKNQTYKCEIPFEVNADNYIIMPYTENNGTINIVERAKGKPVADRLPLAVTDGDIWSRSAVTTAHGLIESNGLRIYPNPVSDVLHVDAEGVSQIEIYDLTGRLVKKVFETNTIPVNELHAGIYIVKVTAANGQTTHRIKKD